MIKSTVKTATLALALLAGSQANAATATANFQSRIVITNACAVSATNMDFGTQGVLSANVDMMSAISIVCSTGTPYSVAINKGTYGTSVTARKMKVSALGTEEVSYSLFRDSTRLANWGNTALVDVVTGVGSGLTQTLNVYGRVPPQTTVSPGTYTDDLTVTLTY